CGERATDGETHGRALYTRRPIGSRADWVARHHRGSRNHFGVGNVTGMVSDASQHLSTSGNGVVLIALSMQFATGSGSVFSTIVVLLILPFTSTVTLIFTVPSRFGFFFLPWA